MNQKLPIHVDARSSILIAEDDPDQSDMLSEALQDRGYKTDTAFSGDVAFKKLLNRRYDLLILDIRMPGISGTEILRSLRQRASRSDFPVMVVTSFATDEDITRYISLGANACLSKPYCMQELEEICGLLITQNKLAREMQCHF